MPEQDFLQRRTKGNLPAHTGKSNSILNRPVTLGVSAFGILALLFTVLIYQRFLIIKETQQKEAYDIVNAAKDKLQEVLAYSSSAIKVLTFFIDNNGTVKNFDSVAVGILNTNKVIDALELAPGGVIRYVYPVRGNEVLIGYDILKDSSRNKEALKTIDKNDLFFSGPFELKQGGIGIVGRLPVFRNKKFWGFSAVVIRLSALLKAAAIDSVDRNGNHFQLSKINPDTKKEESFIHHKKEFPDDDLISVDVPNGGWKLSIKPAAGYRGFADVFILALLGFLISIFGGIFIFSVMQRPKKLNDLVKQRTLQLKESEEKFSRAFHSNVLGFAIYDKDFRIVDINEPYAAILESERNELIGKTSDEAGLISKINIEKRTAISDEIEVLLNIYGQLSNFETEIETKRGELVTVLLSIEQLELSNKKHWLTSVIDITAKKRAEILVQQSELKYRTIIEQAADGIFLADENTYIIDVNRAGCQMLGYAKEELLNMKYSSLIPTEDLVDNPVLITRLKREGTAINERRLFRKDGSIINVDISAKVLSDGRFQSIIRDITERKKTEQQLLESELQFRSLFEQATDCVLLCGIDASIIKVNSSGSVISGYSTEELLRMNGTELFFEDDIKQNPLRIQELLDGKSVLNDRKLKKKDGTSVMVEINTKMMADGRLLSIVRDISERKKVEKQLAENEQRLNRAELMGDLGHGYYNIKNGSMHLSEGLYKIFGVTPETFSHTIDGLRSLIHPDDFLVQQEAVETMFTKGEVEVEFRIVTPGGEVQNVLFKTRLTKNEKGELIDSFTTALCITDRKKAQKELEESFSVLEATLESTADGILVVNLQGRIIRFNKKFADLWNIPRDILATGDDNKAISFVLDQLKTPGNFLSKIKELYAHPEAVSFDTLEFKDGRVFERYSQPQLINERRLGRVWSFRDVTEKFKAKELLEKSYEEIRQLASNLQSIREDERTNIAREIHDELGQQLTGLKMDIHWLSRKIKNADKEINSKIKESIELINSTITSVRKIATDLRPSILDDLGLMAALEWQGDEFEKRSGTKVRFINNAGELEVRPEVATAIFRIYQELLTNIARHANARLVTASLNIEDQTLWFSIKDDGVGFNTDTISNKKTLGLLGIKERTLLMGGTYEIKTRPGEGSETIISIPLNLAKTTG